MSSILFTQNTQRNYLSLSLSHKGRPMTTEPRQPKAAPSPSDPNAFLELDQCVETFHDGGKNLSSFSDEGLTTYSPSSQSSPTEQVKFTSANTFSGKVPSVS